MLQLRRFAGSSTGLVAAHLAPIVGMLTAAPSAEGSILSPSAPKNSQSLLLSKQLLPCEGRHAPAFILPRSSVISSYVSRLFPASLFMTVRTHSEATAILYISRSHVNLISAAYIYMYNLKPLLAVKGRSCSISCRSLGVKSRLPTMPLPLLPAARTHE